MYCGAEKPACGAKVCGDFDLGDCSGSLLDNADLDCGRGRSGVEEERQDVGGGCDREVAADVDQRG
jgi:hypothetical protein